MTHSTQLYTRLEELLPRAAHKPLFKLLEKYEVAIRISRPRSSKWGDYRYGRGLVQPVISVNGDLHESLFLLTLVHEFAHHSVAINFPRRVKPHGTEWQSTFQDMLSPFLENGSFPNEILPELKRHMMKPKATVTADPKLHTALMKLRGNEGPFLFELYSGQCFVFNQRTYQMQGKRRTRFVCKDVSSGRQYLFRSSVAVSFPA